MRDKREWYYVGDEYVRDEPLARVFRAQPVSVPYNILT